MTKEQEQFYYAEFLKNKEATNIILQSIQCDSDKVDMIRKLNPDYTQAMAEFWLVKHYYGR